VLPVIWSLVLLSGPPEGQGRRSGCQAAGAALRAAGAADPQPVIWPPGHQVAGAADPQLPI